MAHLYYLLVTALFLATLAGCKIEISVPEGGGVSSGSGAVNCTSGSTCTVEVTSTDYNDMFYAEPAPGWVFVTWRKGQGYFCGGNQGGCRLQTTQFDGRPNLIKILESNQTFHLEPIFEQGIPLNDATANVTDQVLRSCIESSRATFAQEVRRIYCVSRDYDDIATLEGIEQFSNLREVTLQDHSITDLRPLSALEKLESISIYRGPLEDLAPLADIDSLKVLRLSDNAIANIYPLANLSRLEELYLSGNFISDLSVLGQLKNLRLLQMGDNDIADISPLRDLVKLEQISLNANRISDLNPLRGLRPYGLFLGSNEIRNVRPLADLEPSPVHPFLILELSGNDLRDFTGLARIEHLAAASSAVRLRSNGISDLSSLGNIQVPDLDLSRNQISDLSPLSGIPLESLFLERNQISDLSVFANMPTIRYLVLRENNISDLTPLKSHYPPGSRINQLDLDQNQISIVGDNLSGIAEGTISLEGNPLLCSERQRLQDGPQYYHLPSTCVPD